MAKWFGTRYIQEVGFSSAVKRKKGPQVLIKDEIIGSIPVTTEFSLISCDSNQVPKWFTTHYNLEVPL